MPETYTIAYILSPVPKWLRNILFTSRRPLETEMIVFVNIKWVHFSWCLIFFAFSSKFYHMEFMSTVKF